MNWKKGVTNIIPQFNMPNKALVFQITDILADVLPLTFTPFLGTYHWKQLKTSIEGELNNQTNSLTNKFPQPFSYEKLQLPDEPIEINSFRSFHQEKELEIGSDINVLSMPIKVPERVANRLNQAGRRDGCSEKFSGCKIYIPIELVKASPCHVLRNIIICLL